MNAILNKLTAAKVYALAMVVWVGEVLHQKLFMHMHKQGMILGANAFNKEERIAFENILEGFQDALVLSRAASVYNTDSLTMERASDTIWRPQPYVAQSFTGTDMTSNFKDYVQLSVPATLGFSKSVPWTLTAKELRDALQERRLGEAGKQKLASHHGHRRS